MAIKIGITGGIGSGKSVVSHLFRVLGIPVYLSDIESKRITNTDETVRKELCNLLGEELFQSGELNKYLLASYIFSDPKYLNAVNSIIHPRVRADFQKWSSAYSSETIVGIESAILFESGFESGVDITIMIYAPLELRISRAMKRDCVSRELILERVRMQMDEEEKCKRAELTIVNDGETPLIPQVLKLISSLSKNNHYLCSAKK